MKVCVGVADMKLSSREDDVIVTHALGSCLGLAVYDPEARVGGLLHVMMPHSQLNPEKAKTNPYMFIDTGVPAFFRKLYAAGAQKNRLKVKVAGGANINTGENDRFQTGRRNHTMLKKIFWKNGILVQSEDVGGTRPRTMYLEIATGRVWLSTAGLEKDL